MERLENEVGGHRVQRVPANEKRGRVHTSTVTVAVVLDDGEDGTSHPASRRRPADFRLEWFRGSGAGGQHRNKHANSARVIHLPTGLKQERQGRSREANQRDAHSALLAQLDEMIASELKAQQQEVRRCQVGSGMRGDKRRTYRLQDDMVFDHVTGKSARARDIMNGYFEILWSA